MFFSIHCVSDTAVGIKPTAMSKGNLHNNNEGKISVMSGSAGSARKTMTKGYFKGAGQEKIVLKKWPFE